MQKKLPIGVSDFREMIEKDYFYIDKSLFIKEIIESGSKSLLFPRPRRFGKTLNLSMLRYFYEKTTEDTGNLFQSLKIAQCGKRYLDKQGRYPVIFFTFKDVKCEQWEDCFDHFMQLISDEYRRHKYLLEGEVLDQYEKQEYLEIMGMKTQQPAYERSLKRLSAWLHQYHGEKAVILIDECDTPIQGGYFHGYYDKVILFMRNFLSGGLKDNSSLEKGVLTGILRVAKESIFSGLNNLEVCSLLTHSYQGYFGLLEDEVQNLLTEYSIQYEMAEVKKWYNGYIFGGMVIYNPWSILNFTKNQQDGFRPYWVNTSSNDLIRQILTESSGDVKQDLESLLRGGKIHKEIDDNIVFREIEDHSEALWSFLLMSGYLKTVSRSVKHGVFYCDLMIPNQEVISLYRQIVQNWLKPSKQTHRLLLEALVQGDVETFGEIFRDYVLSTFSMFDISGQEPEKVYHASVLGLLVSLQDQYVVKSNRESGYGRYDVMLIPKQKNKLGIVIEFKKVRRNGTLVEAVRSALRQINEKQYIKELHAHGIVHILKLGIAFAGKELEILAESSS